MEYFENKIENLHERIRSVCRIQFVSFVAHRIFIHRCRGCFTEVYKLICDILKSVHPIACARFCQYVTPFFFFAADDSSVDDDNLSMSGFAFDQIRETYRTVPQPFREQLPALVCKNSKRVLSPQNDEPFMDSTHLPKSLQPNSLLELSFFELFISDRFEKLDLTEIVFLINIFANSKLYIHNVYDEFSPNHYKLIHPSVLLIELLINKLLNGYVFNLNLMRVPNLYEMICIKCYSGVINDECIKRAEENDLETLIRRNEFCYVCNALRCKNLRSLLCKKNYTLNAHFCE